MILIVDDSQDDAILLERFLRLGGLRNSIKYVATGQDAISYLSSSLANANVDSRKVPAVAFVDLGLPDISGFNVLRWISGNCELRSMLLIACSGDSHTKNLQEIYASGANTFLKKSTDPEELLHLLNYFKGHFIGLPVSNSNPA